MKHNDSGRDGEKAVEEYLVSSGFNIVDRNWKTKQCEIDVIAKKDKCIYFVEVKYRSNNDQGDGFEYITPAKLRQMSFAADYWVAQNKWEGEYCLSGASVSGDDYAVEFIEEI
jgi:Holliday junction resolvase-like predicted endonuclease